MESTPACTPYVLQSLANHVDIRPADTSCVRLEFRLLGLACWMDPTGFRIHISINSVARIQAGDQSALDTMPSIMQHILRRYLVILCVMLEELISLHLNHHTDSVVWCLYIYIYICTGYRERSEKCGRPRAKDNGFCYCNRVRISENTSSAES